jgi:hypothetical protein
MSVLGGEALHADLPLQPIVALSMKKQEFRLLTVGQG